MKIKIYGTRGSHAAPSEEYREFYTSKYGANTTSALVTSKNDDLIVLDGGTGIIPLGNDLVSSGRYKNAGLRHKLLFTHNHSDHIEGVPFFKPLYDGRNSFDVYGYREPRLLEELLMARQEQFYFPVAYEEPHTTEKVPFMMAKKKHHMLNGPNIEDTVKIENERTNHPGGCVAYKFTEDNRSIVFGGDHEFGDESIDSKLVELYKGAKIIIQDCQYTPEERCPEKYGLKAFPKRGWGHSDFEQVIEFMTRVNPEILILTHHDPDHDDKFIEKMHERVSLYAKEKGLKSKVLMAQPGMEFEV